MLGKLTALIIKSLKWFFLISVSLLILAVAYDTFKRFSDPEAYEELRQKTIAKNLREKEERDMRRKEREEQNKKQIKRDEQEEKERRAYAQLSYNEKRLVDLSKSIKELSGFSEMSYFSCDSMTVKTSASCGSARELSVLGARHCGEGYSVGEKLSQYFFVMVKNTNDQNFQKHVAVEVEPEVGRLHVHSGKPRDYYLSETAKVVTTYWLDVSSRETLELDRKTLSLTQDSYVDVLASPHAYGIVDGFSVSYLFSAEAPCRLVQNSNREFVDGIRKAYFEIEAKKLEAELREQVNSKKLEKEKEQRDSMLRSQNKI